MIDPECYDSEILLERLHDGAKRNGRSVTFLVGSALSAPFPPGSPGVPTATGVIDLIRGEFDTPQLRILDAQLANAENKYQEAVRFLQGRRGPQIANRLIKRAVWQARKPVIGEVAYQPGDDTDDETCQVLDVDYTGWYLAPGHAALGQLIACETGPFGGSVLTTNFDPLIEAAIATAGGKSFRTILHRDGDLGQTQGVGCHVVHLHGYWHGADTLHSPRQLTQSRPRLKASLTHLISGGTLVVMGYGGWDDVVTQALMEVVLDDRSSPDILWTFNNTDPRLNEPLICRLLPGIDRGRVTFYGDVDCNEFLPKLAKPWTQNTRDISSIADTAPPAAPIAFSKSPAAQVPVVIAPPTLNFSRGEQDHPPKTEFYVGRVDELSRLVESLAAVLYVTGIGGAGKSALAAHYLAHALANNSFDYCVWRDCKRGGLGNLDSGLSGFSA